MTDTPERIALYHDADPAALPDMYARLLDRIAREEPRLRVFEELDPASVRAGLRAQLAALGEDRERPPLFGVPVGVKAVYRTRGYAIRCGSLLPPELFAGRESPLVTELRRAGAVIMGMTASTEFAASEPAPTLNPRAPEHEPRTPGGSSSGSAAGVAAGFFPLALGTQTLGSVIRPAAYCGVTGFKPSQGLLSTRGIVPYSPSADQPGFFCRAPADAVTVMRALTPGAGRTWNFPLRERPRLGVPVGPYLEMFPPATRAWFVKAIAALWGVSIIDAPCLADFETRLRIHTDMTAAEAALVHEAWFKRCRALYRPRTAALIERGQRLGDRAVARGRRSMEELRAELIQVMDEADLDALLCPAAMGEADAGLDFTGDPAPCVPWTHAGLPVLALPFGLGPHGMPLAIQIIGRHGDDARVLALGVRLARTASVV